MPPKTLVMVGMMGAGKTQIGRRLAKHFGLNFVDADEEIETAAGCSIEDLFEQHGEKAFRDGEERVIARLLNDPVHVLATGGGAFMSAKTREEIRKHGLSIWLKADIEVLWKRVSKRSHRPLLKTEDPRGTLARLIKERYDTYAQADITVESFDGPPSETVERTVDAIKTFLTSEGSNS